MDVVEVLQSDMPINMQILIKGFIVQGFKKNLEFEDISKYIKNECDKQFGDEYLCIVVDKHCGFGSCLKCQPGSLFMGEFQGSRVILFRI